MSNPLVSKLRRQVERPPAPAAPPKATLPPERAGWVPGQTATDTVTVQHFDGPEQAAEPNALSGPARPPEATDAQRAGLDVAAQLHARRSAG